MMDSLDASLTPAFGGQPATPHKGGLEVTKKQGRGTGPNAVCAPVGTRVPRRKVDSLSPWNAQNLKSTRFL
ncbi:hypothetical protein GCM10009861_14120 [Neomicrococcus aestuarii]